jgi:hypothetical protein
LFSAADDEQNLVDRLTYRKSIIENEDASERSAGCDTFVGEAWHRRPVMG